MTYRQAMTEAADRLRSAEIRFCETPLLDASVLLAFAAGKTRENLFASYPDEISAEILKQFNRLLDKRLEGMPVSYIRHIKEFFGRDFYVDESVLVPRPDTEILVEKAIELIDANNTEKVLDLCTGSGCIAVSLKLERSIIDITASDISAEALKTAKLNAENHGADVEFTQSDLFEKINDRFDMIVTNPPYLKSADTAEMLGTGWPEPAIALDGGDDGLDFIRIIINSSLDYLKNNGYLLIEAGPDQAVPISKLLDSEGFVDIGITKDLAGRNRVTSGRISGTYDYEI